MDKQNIGIAFMQLLIKAHQKIPNLGWGAVSGSEVKSMGRFYKEPRSDPASMLGDS